MRCKGILFGLGAISTLVRTIPGLLISLLVWTCRPLMRPFRRRRLWTYLVSPVPIVALWDGFVSNLRTYSVGEIRDLVRQVGHQGYEWKIGRTRSIGLSRVTYAIGIPRSVV